MASNHEILLQKNLLKEIEFLTGIINKQKRERLKTSVAKTSEKLEQKNWTKQPESTSNPYSFVNRVQGHINGIDAKLQPKCSKPFNSEIAHKVPDPSVYKLDNRANSIFKEESKVVKSSKYKWQSSEVSDSKRAKFRKRSNSFSGIDSKRPKVKANFNAGYLKSSAVLFGTMASSSNYERPVKLVNTRSKVVNKKQGPLSPRRKQVKQYSVRYEKVVAKSPTVNRRRSSLTFHKLNASSSSYELMVSKYKLIRRKKQRLSTSTSVKNKSGQQPSGAISNKLISSGTSKFLLSKNGKTLRRLSTSLRNKQSPAGARIAGPRCSTPKNNISTFSSPTMSAASRVLQRSIHCLKRSDGRSGVAKSMTVDRRVCMFYCKFGRCLKRESGKCPLVHDPDKVAVCTRFLRGECPPGKKCLFSHKLCADKMPVCAFYLRKTCTKDNCPYLHVNLSANAGVCRNFLKGYCANGGKCKQWHLLSCLEFDRTGVCSKKKSCPLTHRKKRVRVSLLPKRGESVEKVDSVQSNDVIKADQQLEIALRYYQGDPVTSDSLADDEVIHDGVNQDGGGKKSKSSKNLSFISI